MSIDADGKDEKDNTKELEERLGNIPEELSISNNCPFVFLIISPHGRQ